jgi:hypothetical protein
MKEKELREHAECAKCGQKVTKAGIGVLFWIVKVERFVLDLPALQRQQGLGMMIGGALAQVMGPDEDLANPIGSEVSLTICDDCITQPLTIAAILPGE